MGRRLRELGVNSLAERRVYSIRQRVNSPVTRLWHTPCIHAGACKPEARLNLVLPLVSSP